MGKQQLYSAVSSCARSCCSAPILQSHQWTILLSNSSSPMCVLSMAIGLFLVTFRTSYSGDLQATAHFQAAPTKAPRTLLTQRPVSTPASLAVWRMRPCPCGARSTCQSRSRLLHRAFIPAPQESHRNSPLSCNFRGSEASVQFTVPRADTWDRKASPKLRPGRCLPIGLSTCCPSGS